MTTSSAQDVYSITLPSSYSSDTITISNINTYTSCHTSSVTIPNITISNSGISSLTTAQIGAINSINIPTFTFTEPKEFIDCMPDITRLEKMCKEYPGLQIAFEKFKTTYYLVKDDYDTPKDKRVKP